MQIKLADGTTLEVIAVHGASRYFQGANRDSLEIQVEKGKYTLESLDALTGNPENTKKLTILDGKNEYIHDSYTLRAALSVRPVVVTENTSGAPAESEERVCIVLAQKTYAELELESLRDTVDTLVLSALKEG